MADNSAVRDLGSALGSIASALESALTRFGTQGTRLQRRGWLGGLYLAELVPNLLVVAFGAVVIWSASLTISEASFPRHVLGVAMGLVVAALVWR